MASFSGILIEPNVIFSQSIQASLFDCVSPTGVCGNGRYHGHEIIIIITSESKNISSK